mgnify:CR=1 FL=1
MFEPTKILITGASGFIGSFLCEEALKSQMSVWAGIRSTSSRKWLQNEWLQFQTLDMSNRDVLHSQLAHFKETHGKWDIVLHAAGATKCLNKEDFDTVNYNCTMNLVEELKELNMIPKMFVYMSSLSVLGPIKEDKRVQMKQTNILEGDGQSQAPVNDKPSIYSPLLATDEAQPNTAYGNSKSKSENYLKCLGFDFPWVIFRPTGVYGPRETDYFLQFKSINSHVDFSVGFKPQELTFVYVQDLVGAIFTTINKVLVDGIEQFNHKIYHVSDGKVYSSRQFSDLIQRELNVKNVLHIKAPLFVLRIVCAISEWIGSVRGKVSTLNGDKYKIMSQRNWNCDIGPMLTEIGYTPQWNLEQGVKETAAWYKSHGWIK